MTLKELRLSKGLTQQACAKALFIPLRTYVRYELDESKQNTIKYRFILSELERLGLIDETHGVLKTDDIRAICKDVFKNYEIVYCYLFGSYAKNIATERSDVDLLVSSNGDNSKFFELTKELKERLKKNVDVLSQNQLKDNWELIDEILKSGIKIFG